jgi:hypothetical protein
MEIVKDKFAQGRVDDQRLWVGSKKHALSLPEGSVQQGHSRFYGRSVLSVREHEKMARTLLAAFFNRPNIVRPWSCYKIAGWACGKYIVRHFMW